MQQAAYLTEQAGMFGVSLTMAQAQRLLSYLDLMARWNKVHNLTALRDPDKMLTHHILDSLVVAPYVRTEKLLDVGSGAGLPGIPLAITGLQVTVMDSNMKKVSFMRQAVLELGLKNIEVIAGRIENLSPTHKFDGIISRAFSDLNLFVSASRHVLAQHGCWYAMKGVVPDAELQQLPSGIAVQSIQALHIPLLDAQRHLVILKETDG